jgi:hypothetical protein
VKKEKEVEEGLVVVEVEEEVVDLEIEEGEEEVVDLEEEEVVEEVVVGEVILEVVEDRE